MGERYNARTDRYAILHRIANDPDMSAAEAARLFHVARHTVERWCREEGIPLTGHRAPRVSFVLRQKRQRRKRLTQELAQVTREIKALEELDPNAPYQKPKKHKKEAVGY
jgi:predicted DNA-binding transcriptional regulator YafY